MKHYILVLKLLSPAIFLVGLVHLVFGAGGELMLGANLSAAAIADPVLDSQNRFYGVAFTLYGALFYLSATDLKRYYPVLRCAFWVFFAAGLARFVSIYTHGLPSMMVLGLLGAELILPPFMLIWLKRLQVQN